MAKAHPIFNNFTAGEISPKMYGRIDLAKYHNGCIEMVNAVPLPYGGFEGRDGLHFVAPAKYDGKNARMVGFDYSEIQAYMLEMGDEYFRFFMDHGQIMVQDGAEMITNGTFDSDLTGWDDRSEGTGTIAWSSGKMRITGGSGEDDIGWAEQDVTTVDKQVYILQVDVTENPIEIRIGTTSKGNEISKDVELPAGGTSEILFQAISTTTYIQFRNPNDNYGDIDNVTMKTAIPYEISSDFYEEDLPGIKFRQAEDELWFVHPLYLPKKMTRDTHIDWSIDDVEFVDGPYMDEETDPAITPSGTTGDITLSTGSDLWVEGHVGALWRIKQGSDWGYVTITGFTNPQSVDAHVEKDLANTNPSDAWREGAWSDVNGYPRAITFHEGRAVFGGSIEFPYTVWGSKVGKYNDFTPGVEDDDPYTFTLAPDPNAIIRWLISGNVLMVGMLCKEMSLDGGGDNPITPTTVKTDSETTRGSADIDALKIGKATIFVQRMGMKLIDSAYAYTLDSYVDVDLTLLSEHITTGGMTELAYTQEPNSIIWATRADGWLLGCTYNKIHDVTGWSRHSTDGDIEAIASLPASEQDELWCVVKREIDGDTKRYIEYMDPTICVDSGLVYNGDQTTTIRNLDHLVGKTIEIVGDGAVMTQQVVPSSGEITLERAVSYCEAGIGFTPKVITNRPEVAQVGTSQAMEKHWPEIWVRLISTVGVKINGEDVPFRTAADLMDFGIEPYTGDKKVSKLGWSKEGWITIEQTLPMPIQVTCIFGTMQVGE